MTRIIHSSLDSITREDIDSANKNLHVIKLKKSNDLETSWEEAVAHVNNIANEEQFKKLGDFYTIGMLSDDSVDIKNLKPLIQKIENFYQDSVVGICTFTNFATSDSPIVIHKDGWNSCFWQGVGKTEWKIYDSPLSEIYESFIVDSGEFLYIPQGVYHTVVAKEPRFSISFQFLSKNNTVPCCWNCMNDD